MDKYRIITDGNTYRIQKRFLFIWTLMQAEANDRDGCLTIPIEFNTESGARLFIQRQKETKWKVLK